MKHEDSFRLIELMLRMGFNADTIMATLFHCALGKSIGCAYYDGLIQMMEFQEQITCKTESDSKGSEQAI